MKYTVEELMDLPEEEFMKLENANLPNNDEETNEKEWEKRAVSDAQEFVKTSAGAINLLLGK